MTGVVFDFFSYYKAQLVILCAVLLLVAGLILIFSRQLTQKPHILFFPLMVYTVGLIASAIKSAYPAIALNGFFDRDEGLWVLLAYVILFLGASLLISDTRHAWWILYTWMAALCVAGLLGIFQYFGLDLFQSVAGRLLILPAKYHFIASQLGFSFPRDSIYSTLYNPNNVALMFTLAFPFALVVFLLSRSRPRQVVFGLLSGLFGLVLLGTHGRAAWISVIPSLIILIVFSIRVRTSGWWKRFAIIAVVLLVGYEIFNYTSQGSLARRASEPVSDVQKVLETSSTQIDPAESLIRPGIEEGPAEQFIRNYGRMASGRGYIWIRSFQMAQSTLLLGHGPDTFALYFPNSDPYKIFYSQPDVFIDKPHNLYLQIWLNLGGLAALAFVTMLVLHTIQTIRILKRAKLTGEPTILSLGLFLGWFAYILASFFYDSSVSVAPAFWIIFGLSMAANEKLKLEIRPSDPSLISFQ